MLKAATFDEFAFACPFFTSQPWVNNGYGCKHSMQAEQRQDSEGNVGGCCYCWSCPIGIEAEQEDFSNPNIDWDDLCAEGEVAESEYILINVGFNASDNEKAA